MAFLLSDLLTASSQRYPAKIAISYAENHLSYAELDRLANKFGQALLLGGLEAGDLVGIYAHKSLRTVVAILGVLRVGGVYVPFGSYISRNENCNNLQRLSNQVYPDRCFIFTHHPN